jgi:hypothetical protein
LEDKFVHVGSVTVAGKRPIILANTPMTQLPGMVNATAAGPADHLSLA